MAKTGAARTRKWQAKLIARCRARHDRRQKRKAGVTVRSAWFATDGDFKMESPTSITDVPAKISPAVAEGGGRRLNQHWDSIQVQSQGWVRASAPAVSPIATDGVPAMRAFKL
jgi:hypothetical protein